MAAELLLELGFQYSSSSSSSLPHLAETSRDRKPNLNGFNPLQMPDVVDDDDSWEVRAFAEDTANVMGTTWPPRSYTCTYCRREFRSAQALGGHMNVHRRDRARLHQAPPPTNPLKTSSSSSSATSNSFIIPAPDFNGGGLCLLYQFPNPNSSINGGMINSPSSTLNAYIHSPNSSLFSMSHHSFSSFTPSTTSPSPAFPVNNHRPSGATTFSPSFGDDEQHHLISTSMENGNQELDLELRLGHGPPNSTQTLMENGHKISNPEAACLRKRSSD